MIAKLSGMVDSVGDGAAVIDVGGVGYLVLCSARTLARLEPGEAVGLHIETQVREDAIQLFGFSDIVERAWFRMLLAVQGVGPKAALAILSIGPIEELARAIAAGDRATLTRAAGVGAKLAIRIAVELKDKASQLPGMPPSDVGIAASTPAIGGAAADAVSALINLGFRPADASNAVAAALQRLGPNAAVAPLIRAGLGQLSAGEPTR